MAQHKKEKALHARVLLTESRRRKREIKTGRAQTRACNQPMFRGSGERQLLLQTCCAHKVQLRVALILESGFLHSRGASPASSAPSIPNHPSMGTTKLPSRATEV